VKLFEDELTCSDICYRSLCTFLRPPANCQQRNLPALDHARCTPVTPGSRCQVRRRQIRAFSAKRVWRHVANPDGGCGESPWGYDATQQDQIKLESSSLEPNEEFEGASREVDGGWGLVSPCKNLQRHVGLFDCDRDTTDTISCPQQHDQRCLCGNRGWF